MKRSIGFRLPALFLAVLLLGFNGYSVHGHAAVRVAQAEAASPSGNAGEAKAGAPASTTKAEDTEEDAAFRHSSAVKKFAGWLHLDIETAAKIFEDLNSGLLILAILWFLFKALPKAFRKRSDTIEKQLVEARTATEQANERLTAVEKRLSRLGDEIEAIRRTAEEDSVADEARIKRSMEEERKRIVESAEHEIEAAGAAAERHLKQFAAELAVTRAVERIRLTADEDRRLVENFGRDLAQGSTSGSSKASGNGGRN